MTTMRTTAALLALVLVAAACGDDQPSSELPPAPDDAAVSGPAMGACLEGEPDCQDTVVDGEPLVAPPPGEGGTSLPDGSEMTIAEALETGGPVSLVGFYVDSGDGPRLCEALAESFPPQCGGASIPLADLSPIDPESIRTEGSTSWSDYPVYVVGDVVDGVLVPTPISS